MRSYSVELILVAVLVLAVAFFGYLGYGLLQAEVAENSFNGDAAMAYVTRQMEVGPRPVTSPGNLEVEQFLITELSQGDWEVAVQPYIARVSPEVAASDILSATTDAQGRLTMTAHNVIAFKDPAEPPADLPVGLLITHFDSRVVSDLDPNVDLRDTPAPDANGAASGAAVLLELARILELDNIDHRLCLVFLNGEANRELDGWETTYGGEYFVRGLLDGQVPDCADPRFAVMLDLVGGVDQQIYVEQNADLALSSAIWGTAVSLNYDDWIIPEAKWAVDGPHLALGRAGIPTTLMVDYDYPYRRTTSDQVDKLDPESLHRIGRVLRNWLEQGAPIEE